MESCLQETIPQKIIPWTKNHTHKESNLGPLGAKPNSFPANFYRYVSLKVAKESAKNFFSVDKRRGPIWRLG